MRNKIIQSDLEYITSQDLPWESFEGKTVLVSGAAGFLPSYMVDVILYLRENKQINVQVIALVRNLAKAKKRFLYAEGDISLELVEQDVCDDICIDRKIDFIIHAASNATPKVFRDNPVGTILPNVIGTNNLLEVGKRNNIDGFLFFSTSGVYGFVNDSDYPIKENCFGSLDSMDLASCYLDSKRMGENLCVSWKEQYGMPIKVVRPAITYGPGLDLTNGRSFEDFISSIVLHRDIELYSDGSAVRNFCYIADAIYGFFTVMLKGENGGAYNVATDHEISIKGLADYLVEEVFPDRELKVVMKNDYSKNFMRMNFSKTTVDINKVKSLGWELNFPIKEGFKRAVESIECE